MNNQLELLAMQGMQIVIPASTLKEYLDNDRKETFMDGIREGILIAEQQRKQALERPLTKQEAAEALGVSVGTIDNLRRNGDLEAMEYGEGLVRIDQEELLRFKRTHRSLKARINN